MLYIPLEENIPSACSSNVLHLKWHQFVSLSSIGFHSSRLCICLNSETISAVDLCMDMQLLGHRKQRHGLILDMPQHKAKRHRILEAGFC